MIQPSGVSALGAAVWGRRKLLATAIFTAVVAGAVTAALSLPGIYRSVATVLVERQEMQGAFVRPAVTSELEARLHTIGQEILSRARLETLMNRFDLYRDLRSRMVPEGAMEQLRRDIQVELKGVEPALGRGPTIAFTVSFRGRDPETVARVANALASFYVEENIKIRERQATAAVRLSILQVEETKRRLEEQERKINEFKRRHIGELPEQVAANLATLERLNAQLTLNSNGQMRAMERRAALVRQLADAQSSAAATGEDAPTARLARLKRELARMRKLFSDRYPDVVALKAEIATTERQVADAGPAGTVDPTVTGLRTSLGELDAEISALKAEEQRLRRDTAAYQRRVESAPEREQELQEMSRDYRTTRELYDAILKRYQDAQVAEDMERRRTGEEFRILDPAVPALHPVAPDRARLILIGALLALGLAAAAIVLAEHRDTSFHTLDDLRSFTRVPVLASIPRIATAGDTAQRWRQGWLATASIALGVALVVLASYHVAHGNEQLARILSRGGS
ncbi:MAG: hypothetical protein HY727_17745 [Candidatus Rokubacteria bacterium]|nr:hypothetical protein [Candidatus Rokubacteria bacterium]